jgi:serine/threonine protein kinase
MQYTNKVQSYDYRAPEIHLMECEPSAHIVYNDRVDIWGLGIVILEMLLGHRLTYMSALYNPNEALSFFLGIQDLDSYEVQNVSYHQNYELWNKLFKRNQDKFEEAMELWNEEGFTILVTEFFKKSSCLKKFIGNLFDCGASKDVEDVEIWIDKTVFLLTHMLCLKPEERWSASTLYGFWIYETDYDIVTGINPVYGFEQPIPNWSTQIDFAYFSKISTHFRNRHQKRFTETSPLTPFIATHIASRSIYELEIVNKTKVIPLFVACYCIASKLNNVCFFEIKDWLNFCQIQFRKKFTKTYIQKFESLILRTVHNLGYCYVQDEKDTPEEEWNYLWDNFMDIENHYQVPLIDLVEKKW